MYVCGVLVKLKKKYEVYELIWRGGGSYTLLNVYGMAPTDFNRILIQWVERGNILLYCSCFSSILMFFQFSQTFQRYKKNSNNSQRYGSRHLLSFRCTDAKFKSEMLYTFLLLHSQNFRETSRETSCDYINYPAFNDSTSNWRNLLLRFEFFLIWFNLSKHYISSL